MNLTSTGWVIFIAAVGMMCSLLAVDIYALDSFNQVASPKFVGLTLAHLAAVIGAFVGGKLIPPDRAVTQRTRQTDMVALPKDIVAERKANQI